MWRYKEKSSAVHSTINCKGKYINKIYLREMYSRNDGLE
jgi:hypothetical protein